MSPKLRILLPIRRRQLHLRAVPLLFVVLSCNGLLGNELVDMDSDRGANGANAGAGRTSDASGGRGAEAQGGRGDPSKPGSSGGTGAVSGENPGTNGDGGSSPMTEPPLTGSGGNDGSGENSPEGGAASMMDAGAGGADHGSGGGSDGGATAGMMSGGTSAAAGGSSSKGGTNGGGTSNSGGAKSTGGTIGMGGAKASSGGASSGGTKASAGGTSSGGSSAGSIGAGGRACKPTDSCDQGNDDNCNGKPNEGCDCINGASRACGECGQGQQTCVNGTFSPCSGDPGKVAYYLDVDQDGYFSRTPAGSSCQVPAGSSKKKGDDCCDDDCYVHPGSSSTSATLVANDCHPGSTGWSDAHGVNKCGKYDYNCDDVDEAIFTENTCDATTCYTEQAIVDNVVCGSTRTTTICSQPSGNCAPQTEFYVVICH